MTTPGAWASDTKVSLPAPIDPRDILLDMGDRVFTANGMFIKATAADLQEIAKPTFAPPVVPQ